MPDVPGYKPPENIKPNLELLTKLRQQNVVRERKAKQPKIDKMREEHTLKHPNYWLKHHKNYNSTPQYATELMDEVTLKHLKRFC